jgi:lipid II:glycine glycyltransferase (peptidoglycan interpeptide bridge formation enzyme)
MTLTAKEKYRSICAAYPGIPVFHQDWWLDTRGSWDASVVYHGDHPAGIWPFTPVRRAGIDVLRNPVLTPYLGPHIFFPQDLASGRRDGFQQETIGSLFKTMPRAPVWHLGLQPGIKQAGLFSQHGFDISARQTFLLDLDRDEQLLLADVDEGHRRKIRKARTELTIKHEPEMLPFLWQYQRTTLERKQRHLHHSLDEMKKVFKACLDHNACSLLVARIGSEVQGLVWIVWDDNKAYYLAGAKNPMVRDKLSMTALLWQAITDAKVLGKKVFDFEGSMDPGVERFFRHFGARRELYLTIHKNSSTLWKIKDFLLDRFR